MNEIKSLELMLEFLLDTEKLNSRWINCIKFYPSVSTNVQMDKYIGNMDIVGMRVVFCLH